MISKNEPNHEQRGLLPALRILRVYGAWVLLPLGIALGVLSRQSPQPPDFSAARNSDVKPAALLASVRDISISSDEQYLDVMQSDGTWRRHDAHTGRELWRRAMTSDPLTLLRIRGEDFTTIGKTSQGRLTLLTESGVLWNGELPQHQAGEDVQSCELCPRCSSAAAVSDQGSLWILQFKESQQVSSVRHSVGASLSKVSWAPSGDQLALVTTDRELLIWDVAQARIVERSSNRDDGCRFAAWSGDGRRIITCGCENEVTVWQAEGLAPVRRLRVDSNLVLAAELSEDGKRAAIGDGETIAIWEVDEDAAVDAQLLHGHDDPVIDLRFADGGTALFSVDSSNRMIRWSVTDYRQIWSFPD